MNHVIYDRLWESKRLARCSRDAALAYPWIFLVADDHGRFEYRPARIWAKVFGGRKDVTSEDVAGWLEEYARQGLLVRYHMDGELAYWHKFKGRKPSERRPSDYPDPAQFEPFTVVADEGAEKRGSGGDESRDEPRQIDARDRSDQIRDRAEQNGSSADAEPPRKPTWSAEACELWQRFMGTPPGGRIGAALKPLVTEHTWSVVRPLWQAALEEAVSEPDPAYFTPEVFARTFVARLARSRAGPGAALVRVGARGLDVKAERRKAAMVAGVIGGLKGDGTFGGG